MATFIDALDAEIAALAHEIETDPRHVKLRELRRVRGLYVDDKPWGLNLKVKDVVVSATGGDKPRAVRQPSPQRARAVEAAMAFLAGQAEPVPTSTIYQHLVSQGIELGGVVPHNNLSALLSHIPRFKSHGRDGWTLVWDEKPPEHAEAAGSSPKETPAAPVPTRLTSGSPDSSPVDPWRGGGT